MVTVWAALYQPLLGVTVPGPLTFMVRLYWWWKVKTVVVADAVPLNVPVEYHR